MSLKIKFSETIKQAINSYPYLLIVILQIVLVSVAFNKILFSGNEYILENKYDGFKNYFTLTEYISQPENTQGVFHFSEMNYPFGEYIFYTDNTPILAIFLRFINQKVINIEAYDNQISHFIFFACIIISSLLAFKLFKPLVKNHPLLLILIAISFSWINPQFMRFFSGHFNLSLSIIPLITLLFLLKIHQIYLLNLRKWPTLILLFIFIVFSSFLHLYYIPLIATPTLIFCSILFLTSFKKNKKASIINFISYATIIALSGVSVLLFIKNIDSYYLLRSSTAQGFDWTPWKFTPEAFFTPYHFNSITPFLKSCKMGNIAYESYGFIGNFLFYSSIFILAYSLYYSLRIKGYFKTKIKQFFNKPLYVALALTMFFSYAIACGSYIKLCIIPIGFDNVFSPFFYFKNIDFITQFRCISRFSWIAWWIFAYLIIVLLIKIINSIESHNKVLNKVIIAILCLLLIIDLKDFIQFTNSHYNHNPFIKTEDFQKAKQTINFENYQAFYTIPMVQVGSETDGLILDDQYKWTQYWMSFARYSQLATFNSKMSRTAVNQAQAQFDLVLNQEVPQLINEKLNDKAILVLFSPQFENQLKLNEHLAPQLKHTSSIIEAFKMDTLAEINGVYYLHWDVKTNH